MRRQILKQRTHLAAVAVAFACAALGHAAEVYKDNTNNVKVEAGVDARFRYDVTEHLPNSKHGEKENSDYLRFRVRPYFGMDAGKFGFYARLADEIRWYDHPESERGKEKFPDVAFIDNLYFSGTGLFDNFIDFRIGRQDIRYGSSRIISDGTGGDGSRSAYFDAVKFSFNFAPTRVLDAFYLYSDREDWLPTLGKTHDHNGDSGHNYDTTGYNQSEHGAGLYWQDKSIKEMPYELYYVAKLEVRGEDAKYRSEAKNFWSHTIGFRLMPKYTDTLSSEFEGAIQAGSESLLAGQVYGDITYAPKLALKPFFTAAVWYLSGDSDGDRGNNAWHAVFNRETGLGESLAPMYNKYDYTNLLYPHLASGLTIAGVHKLHAQLGPMFAPANEIQSGEEYGNYRGLYAKATFKVKLAALFGEWAKGGEFALRGEWLDKGDYFRADSRHSALFCRAEIYWKF